MAQNASIARADISNVICVEINNMAIFPLRVLFNIKRAERRINVSWLLCKFFDYFPTIG